MDKLLHVSASALFYLGLAGFLTITGASASFPVIAACSAFFTLLIGAIKELVDYSDLTEGGHASWGDMLANGVGTAVGVLIHRMF